MPIISNDERLYRVNAVGFTSDEIDATEAAVFVAHRLFLGRYAAGTVRPRNASHKSKLDTELHQIEAQAENVVIL